MTNNQNSKKSSNQSQKAWPKIIYIEDDEMLRRVYENKLTIDGFEVDLAINGQEAIQKLKANDYDLVLLDLILPDIDGFQVLAQLRASGWPAAKKPVIVFSNLGNASDINKARKLGANDYLVKARITPNNVTEKIREYLK